VEYLEITGTNTCSGSIAALTELQYCIVGGNSTLTFPNVTNITGISYLYVHNTTTLTSANVNQLLADMWTNRNAAKPSVYSERRIEIEGSVTSGGPTGQGIIDKAALQAYRSPNPPGTANVWTVNTRTIPSVLRDGNTVAWYDYNELSTITKDGDEHVTRWNDFLGSGNDLVTVGGTPHWSANGILFDGTGDYLKTASWVLSQPQFFYMVIKQITWTDSDDIFDGFDNANRVVFAQRTGTPNIAVYALGGGFVADNVDLAINTWGIVRLLANGASSKIIIDANAPTTGDPGASGTNGLTLGCRFSCDTGWANIEVKEIIMRDVADAAGDEAIIYAYLKDKHGL